MANHASQCPLCSACMFIVYWVITKIPYHDTDTLANTDGITSTKIVDICTWDEIFECFVQ